MKIGTHANTSRLRKLPNYHNGTVVNQLTDVGRGRESVLQGDCVLYRCVCARGGGCIVLGAGIYKQSMGAWNRVGIG
jgi:hypothetical protein